MNNIKLLSREKLRLETISFVADLLPTRHHIPLPWIMAYDLYPLQTLETKRKWVPRLEAIS